MPLQMRLPKFGFKSRKARTTAEVRLGELSRIQGDTVSMDSLREAKIIGQNALRARVILSGKLDRALTLLGVGVTAGARAAVEKAGGRIAGQEEVEAARRTAMEEARRQRSAGADESGSKQTEDSGNRES